MENDGNAPLDVTAITRDANAQIGSIPDPCGVGNLAVAVDCTIGAVFAPTVAGNPLIANIDVAGDTQPGPPTVIAPNSPLDIQLIGNAPAVNSTSVVVTSSLESSGFGQSVTLTATVQTGSGTGNLTGTVTFYNGGVAIPSASGLPVGATTTSGSNSTASASFQTALLPVGANSITATYNVAGTPSDPAHSSSNNNTSPYIQNVLEATTTAIVSSQNPSALGQNVKFTATVSISGGGGVTPDGSVTFYDGASALQTVTLTTIGATGVASYSTTALTQGAHGIKAIYSGGVVVPQVQGSTSNTVTQNVQTASTVVVMSGLNPSNYGQPVTFTATITPSGTAPATGTVNFLDSGVPIGSGTILGTTNQASFAISTLAVGSHTITAAYLGDAGNGPSTSLPITQTVNKTQTSTIVAATPTPNGIAGGSIIITATVKVIAGSATTTG
jgi:hypothetical protein